MILRYENSVTKVSKLSYDSFLKTIDAEMNAPGRSSLCMKILLSMNIGYKFDDKKDLVLVKAVLEKYQYGNGTYHTDTWKNVATRVAQATDIGNISHRTCQDRIMTLISTM